VSLQVLDGNNPKDIHAWEDLVEGAPTPDVYYRPAYARAYAVAEQAQPVAVLVRSGLTEALFPLLIREFEVRGQEVKDAVTPYGYGGLLLASGPTEPEPSTVRKIFDELRDWTRASDLINCTLRFHPLLDQEEKWHISQLCDERAHLFSRGQTSAIDLDQWDANRRTIRGMHKGRRYDFKKARSALRVDLASGQQAKRSLNTFRVLYKESMERVHADGFFFFSEAYFNHLADELDDKFAIATAWAGDLPVAASIFLADRDFVHYHLAASNEEGKRHAAATLHIVAASEWAVQRRCSFLHLGGGLSDNDGLWRFKNSFGGKAFTYSYMVLISDWQRYEELQNLPGIRWPYANVGEQKLQAGGSRVARPVWSKAIRRKAEKMKVVGIGAGGHARVIIDILSHSPGFQVVGLVEVAESLIGGTIEGSLILGDDELLPQLLEDGVRLAFIGIGGIGNNRPRADAFSRVLKLGFDVISAIHPRAVVARSAIVGRGVCAMAGVVVNPGAFVGENVILNSNCTIEHDCVLGDHVHIAPGVTLSGAVQIGSYTHIGTGASVRQGVRIGNSSIVGVGAVVVNDVPDDTLVVGVPARPVNVISQR
jgi:UDP-perosamine 4-acetyltransferase